MTLQPSAILASAATLLIGIALGANLRNEQVAAQAPTTPRQVLVQEQAIPAVAPLSRYQISSYAGPVQGGGFGHGCYIIDTQSGQIWHSRQGGTAERVSEKLP